MSEWMDDEAPRSAPEMIDRLARDLGGRVEEVGRLPDGSGFAVVDLPLPEGHWIGGGHPDEPPAPLRMGTGPLRDALAEAIRAAGRYALLASIRSPDEVDFDPDAYLQNLVVGLLGYWTDDGRSHL